MPLAALWALAWATLDIGYWLALPLAIAWYTTILDLGPWGALYTEGWERRLVSRGATAKRTKELINRERIYPPRSAERQAILDAAAPTVQTPPVRFD